MEVKLIKGKEEVEGCQLQEFKSEKNVEEPK
jgi:hypothetical protein